jgi:hypothetical protein
MLEMKFANFPTEMNTASTTGIMLAKTTAVQSM